MSNYMNFGGDSKIASTFLEPVDCEHNIDLKRGSLTREDFYKAIVGVPCVALGTFGLVFSFFGLMLASESIQNISDGVQMKYLFSKVGGEGKDYSVENLILGCLFTLKGIGVYTAGAIKSLRDLKD